MLTLHPLASYVIQSSLLHKKRRGRLTSACSSSRPSTALQENRQSKHPR